MPTGHLKICMSIWDQATSPKYVCPQTGQGLKAHVPLGMLNIAPLLSDRCVPRACHKRGAKAAQAMPSQGVIGPGVVHQQWASPSARKRST
eukprot:10553764-Lingulodinium_polyedra.AAC.1